MSVIQFINGFLFIVQGKTMAKKLTFDLIVLRIYFFPIFYFLAF